MRIASAGFKGLRETGDVGILPKLLGRLADTTAEYGGATWTGPDDGDEGAAARTSSASPSKAASFEEGRA